jgi:hypothetical protein
MRFQGFGCSSCDLSEIGNARGAQRDWSARTPVAVGARMICTQCRTCRLSFWCVECRDGFGREHYRYALDERLDLSHPLRYGEQIRTKSTGPRPGPVSAMGSFAD